MNCSIEQGSGAAGQPSGAAGQPNDPAPDGPAFDTGSGVPLRQLLIAVGEPLVDVLAAPRGFDPCVRGVVIVDPEEDSGTQSGDFVLVIGARGRAAIPLVRAAARSGATAVAVKIGPAGAEGTRSEPLKPEVLRGAERDVRLLRDAAIDSGIALLGVKPDVRWEQLEAFARSVLDNARLTTGAEEAEALGDLFALAQTVAAMTQGIVSIEDNAHRVLAYSRSDDEVDELRRLSILGRRGPEPFLAMLREWGVYQRLRRGEEVVSIDERPHLGIRRRMAVGIHAGAQPLGTIWVQQGSRELADHSERALLGAARVAALQLIRQRTETTAAPRFRESLLAGLLDGRVDADSVADNIGADIRKPGVVAAFTLKSQHETGVADRAGFELQRAEVIGLISVHAAAYRRSALVTTLGSRVYVLLPDLTADSAVSAVFGLTRDIVHAAEDRMSVRVQAAVGAVAPLSEVATSRVEADRILDALSRDPAVQVATIADVRAEVLVGEVLSLIRDTHGLRDPRIAALAAHDLEQGTDLARSLLAYLEAFGDVRTASAKLHVHPNTLRHRIKRAADITEVDLKNPSERLNAQLQLGVLGKGDGSA